MSAKIHIFAAKYNDKFADKERWNTYQSTNMQLKLLPPLLSACMRLHNIHGIHIPTLSVLLCAAAEIPRFP